MASKTSQKAKASSQSSNADGNILYIFAYLLGWLSGIVVFLVAKPGEKRVKFHGLQAVFLGIVATILYFIPIVGGIIALLLWLLGLVVGIKAYQGEDMSLPVIGDLAKQHSQ